MRDITLALILIIVGILLGLAIPFGGAEKLSTSVLREESRRIQENAQGTQP